MTGKVKRFLPEKGFGFIREDNSMEDHFFHVSSLVENVIIKEEDPVTFQMGNNKQGPCAVRIRKIDGNDKN